AHRETGPSPDPAPDADRPSVHALALVSGRGIDPIDETSRSRTAVVGSGLAREFEMLPGELRVIELSGIEYAVVGILGRVELEPGFDNAVFVPFGRAAEDFADVDPDEMLEANKLYVRSVEGRESETADALRSAVNLGGPQEITTEIKSEALELAAQSDRQLQLIVVSMGLLAIIVGGLGIANVMSISVIQRSAEIGIRRALGHTRRIIASQFLLEAMVVGVLGGSLGVLVGMLAIFVGVSIAGWVFVMATWLAPAGIVLAVAISVLAGLYPAVRAARLEPLETLRLG
ncbi:MAG: ABC transporter permease, partial [Ilumatobacteraceae bacterium]